MNVVGLIDSMPGVPVAKGCATGTLLQRVRHIVASKRPIQPLPPMLLQDSRLDHELWDGSGSRYQEGMFQIPLDAKFHGVLVFDKSAARIYTTERYAFLLVINPLFSQMETELWDRDEIDKRFENAPPWDPQNQRRLPIDRLPDSFKRGGMPYFLERKGPLPWLSLHNILRNEDFTSAILRAPEAPFPTGAKLELRTIFQRYRPAMRDEVAGKLRSIEQTQEAMELLLNSVKYLILQHAHEDTEPSIKLPSLLHQQSLLQSSDAYPGNDSVLAATTTVVRRASPAHSSTTDETVDITMSCFSRAPRNPVLADLICGMSRPQIAHLCAHTLDAADDIIRHLFASTASNEPGDTTDAVLARRLVHSKFTDDAVCLFEILIYLGSLLQRGSALLLVDVTSDGGGIGRLVMTSSSGVSALDLDLAHRLLFMSEVSILIVERTSFAVTTPYVPKVQRMRLKIDQRRRDELVSAIHHGSKVTIEHGDTAAGPSKTQSNPGEQNSLSNFDMTVLIENVNSTAQTAVAQAVHELVGPESGFERQLKSVIDTVPAAVAAAIDSALQSRPALSVPVAAVRANMAENTNSDESPCKNDAKRSCEQLWNAVRRLKTRLGDEGR